MVKKIIFSRIQFLGTLVGAPHRKNGEFMRCETEFMFTLCQSDSDGRFKFHIAEIHRFFYGVHLLEYLIAVFWNKYIILLCRCLRSLQYPFVSPFKGLILSTFNS